MADKMAGGGKSDRRASVWLENKLQSIIMVRGGRREKKAGRVFGFGWNLEFGVWSLGVRSAT